MKKLFTMCIFCALTCFISMLCSSCRPHSNKDAVEVSDSDSITQSIPTIADMLQEREILKHGAFVDSVYLHMPMPILVNILTQKGTLLPYEDIVNEYITHKESYDNDYRHMKTVNNYMNNPDSLPKISYPEQRADTIIRIIRSK